MSGVHTPGIAQVLHPLLPCINVTQPGTARVPGLICIRLPVTSGIVHLKCDGTKRDACFRGTLSPTGVLLSASGTIGLRHKPRARPIEVCLLRNGGFKVHTTSAWSHASDRRFSRRLQREIHLVTMTSSGVSPIGMRYEGQRYVACAEPAPRFPQRSDR
jgi:hypothetical protein